MNYEQMADDFLMRMGRSRFNGPVYNLQRFPRGEMLAMMYLEEFGIVNVGEICNSMQVSSARTAAILDKLEKKGMIERRMDENDRRKVVVEITEDGSSFVKHKKNMMRELMCDVFRMMGERDAKEFIRLSAKFAVCMDQITERRSNEQHGTV